MSKPSEEIAADSVHSGLTPEQQETADRLFARAIQLKRAQGRIDDRTGMFELPEELPLLSKCEWLWGRLFPNVEWDLTKVATWMEVECGVSSTDTPHFPLDKLFALLKHHFEPQAKAPVKRGATKPKKKRWFPEVVQHHCDLVMKSQDPELIETYLLLEGKKLAKLIIGCDAKTLYKTVFWKERPDAQAKWRRENSTAMPRRKRDSQ